MKWNIGWGFTSKCNMRCAFCYSEKKRESQKDVDFLTCKKFINDNFKNINTINFGTGENTLSDDWFVLVKHIRDNYPDIGISLTTNGYLSEAIGDEFKFNVFKNCIDEIDVSLDFADAESHNSFRGQHNAYKWAIDTLEICKKYNKKTTIVFLGSKKNALKDNVNKIFLIAKKYDAIVRMNIYRPTNGIDNKAKEFIMDRQQIIDLLMYINENHIVISLGDAYFAPILTGLKRSDPSGADSLRILPNGTITPSTYLINDSYCVGSIYEENVLENIHKKIQKKILPTIPMECNDCFYKNICQGGVYDRRILWYGTLLKKDPYCITSYDKEIPAIIKTDSSNFRSIHDDYLPTMFFKPRV